MGRVVYKEGHPHRESMITALLAAAEDGVIAGFEKASADHQPKRTGPLDHIRGPGLHLYIKAYDVDVTPMQAASVLEVHRQVDDKVSRLLVRVVVDVQLKWNDGDLECRTRVNTGHETARESQHKVSLPPPDGFFRSQLTDYVAEAIGHVLSRTGWRS